MTKKQKRTLLIFLAVIGIYVIIVLIFTKDTEEKQNPEGGFSLLLNPDTKINYYDKLWSKTSPSSTDDDALYQLYDNNAYIGDYYMLHNRYIMGYNIFQKENGKKVNYYNPESGNRLLGIHSDIPISVRTFSVQNIEDNTPVKQILNEVQVQADLTNVYQKQVNIDYDHDGEVEEIYMISNAFDSSESYSNAFSIIFENNGGRYKILYSSIRNVDEIYDICVPYLHNVININETEKDSLIFGCEYYSNNGTCHMLYGPKDKDYEMLLTC